MGDGNCDDVLGGIIFLSNLAILVGGLGDCGGLKRLRSTMVGY